MTSPHAIERALRPHADALRGLGIRSLVLFGSAARSEMEPGSDVDLLYEFLPEAATLDHILGLQDLLEAALGRSVDLVSRKHIGSILQRYIGDETVTVYERASQG